MKITAIAHGLDLAHSYSKRTPGVHMSDLYGALYAALEPKRYAKKHDQPPPKERWGIGMAFEEMLEEGLKARVFNTNEHEDITRPGEYVTEHTLQCTRPRRRRYFLYTGDDGETCKSYGVGCVCGGGVIFSPDLLIFNGKDRTGEIKLNSMSAKGAPWKLGATYSGFDQKFSKYTCQMMVYNYHLATPYSRLYSFSMREMVYFNEPGIFRAWDVDFTPREMTEEWGLVHRNAVQLKLLTA